MGWLWSSAPSQSPSSPSSESTPQAPSSQPPPQKAPESVPKALEPASKVSHVLSRDEQADAEFAALIRELSTSEPTAPPPSKPRKPSRLTYQPTSSEGDAPIHPSAAQSTSNSDDDDSLYPSHMSCTQAFDSAFYCQSLGGKFNDIYRYGELRSCSEHWSAFWFCMRTKSASAEERPRLVQEHYRQRAAKYKTKPSSDDVWEARTEPLAGAFEQPIDTP